MGPIYSNELSRIESVSRSGHRGTIGKAWQLPLLLSGEKSAKSAAAATGIDKFETARGWMKAMQALLVGNQLVKTHEQAELASPIAGSGNCASRRIMQRLYWSGLLYQYKFPFRRLRMRLTATAALVLIAGLASTPSLAASDGWINRFHMERIIKQQKKTGMIPMSITCRNNPRYTHDFHPEFKIGWKENTARKDWQVRAGVLDPYNTGFVDNQASEYARKEGFRVVSQETYRLTRRGKEYRCAVWHR